MKIVDSTPREAPPKGKRTVRETARGNTQGYIGGRFWKTIGITYRVGTAEAVADFLAGRDEKS
jgi:hypothetical protein